MTVNSVRHSFLCNNSGLLILLHGIISLPDPMSYDKQFYSMGAPGYAEKVSKISPGIINKLQAYLQIMQKTYAKFKKKIG